MSQPLTEPHISAKPLSILVVCTGNICRSALAHHYLAQHLQQVAPEAFQVSSAGTGWFEGLTVPRDLIEIAPEVADRLNGHASGPLEIAQIRAADLILTATAEHRSRVLVEVPAAFKRTFTIREFATVLAERGLRPGADPDAWRAAIAQVARYRGGADDADIEDPYRRGRAAYKGMRETMLPLLDVVIDAARSE
ncbi:MAG: hypothetical protein LKG20_05510 [Tetrasphaera jenkinsii]|jgi:protein-tyrosine phosphatase|nr:hypothetical protein [Tetrasphaera jenkinsii]